MKIDITTGDEITPAAIEYSFHTMFDESDIKIIHYVYSIYDRPWYKKSYGSLKKYWVKIAVNNGLPLILSKRKIYSRTSIIGFVYRHISKTIALNMIRNRTIKTIKQIEGDYRKEGYVFYEN